MEKITLVILAAGMGSRFGGLKQIEPVDPEGHIIIDFSLFDAWRAGFRDVVFIIKREMEAEFRECIGDRMEQYFHVSYVYQDLDRLPEGIEAPEGRTKPWGTGHALACCKGVVNGPFAVINADDFCLYRTAFLLDREADVLRVWYGGKKKSDASWGIGYTEGRYSQICAALE